jgi:hypothetical protein
MGRINMPSKQELQGASRAFFELMLSIAGNTQFILGTVSNIAVLSGKKDYEEGAALRYSTIAIISLISLIDAYVHFFIYSHRRYRQDESVTLTQDRQGSSSLVEQGQLLMPATSLIEGSGYCHNHNHGHGHGHGHGGCCGSDSDGAKLDGGINVGASTAPRDDADLPSPYGSMQEAVPLLSSNIDQSDVCFSERVMNMFSILCAFSCSLDTASAPSVVMALLRSMSYIPEISEAQRIVELSLTTLAVAVSFWNAPVVFGVAKKHFSDPSYDQGSCCSKH